MRLTILFAEGGAATGTDRRNHAAVYAMAFAIPAAVLLWTYRSMGMAPWGDKTILISDMSSVYVELFCALKRGEVFFSWSRTMGAGYIGVFSYHVSSPLSFLTLLVPNEAMPVGLMFLTALKLGLAGLSYAVYSVRRFPGARAPALLCAVCYGLMSYNVAYSLSIMWLDGVIWLPLILLALERVLAGKGAVPFIGALTACFLSTWYISYMIGIFCCVYLAVRLAALKPRRTELLRVLGRFFGGALCALGLTAWMWLPTFLSMLYGKFQEGGWDTSRLVYGPLSDVFGQLLPGRLETLTNSALPNIFCGTVTLLLAVAWFFLKTVPLREKLAGAGALAFLFASLWSTVLDRAWHLFQYPNWFPYRYSFVVSFFLLCLANQTAAAGWEMLKKRPRSACALAAVLLLFTVGELRYNTKTLLNTLDGAFRYQSYAAYRDYYTANAALVDAAREDSGGAFCRVNSAEDRGHNAPLSFGYPGLTHYSSIYNTGVNSLLRRLGMAQAWYWSSGYGSTPATDALFDLQYTLSRREMPGYELLGEERGLKLWKNPDVLPLAFLAEGDAPELAGDSPFARQNGLFSALTGEGAELFTPVAADTAAGAGETALTFVGSGRPVYADLSASGLREVLVNGEHLLWLGASEAASVHCLGTPAPGEEWTVTVRHSGHWSGGLWELDQGALHAAVERLDNTEILSVEKNGRVRLTARADGARPLLTTIPAEKGWTAWVDGERAETGVWLGAFLTVPLAAGAHEVELRYTAPGLVPGVALGALSLAALVLMTPKKWKKL